MLDSFVDDWQVEKMNDTGNRNLCGCNKVICTRADFKSNNGYKGRHYINDRHGWKSYKEAKALGLIDKRTSETGAFINGACKKHDLWHVYSSGRSGATLYWDKYWKESRMKCDEYDLQGSDIDTLKTTLEEMTAFNKRVTELMTSFYIECEYRVKEARIEKKEEERIEKLYQKTLKTVRDNQFTKRLITELI